MGPPKVNLQTHMLAVFGGGVYYDLNMKCPPQAHVLGAWLAADVFLGSHWILRALIQ
jgi:hypothetical protein